VNIAQAEALFPPYDGVTHRLGNTPTDFASTDPARFRFWHTAHQVEYIQANGTDYTGRDGALVLPSKEISLPPGLPPEQQLHAILSANGRGVIILNDLTADLLQRLPLDDQRLVADHPRFADLVGIPFGFALGGPEAAREAQIDRVKELQQTIEDVGPLKLLAGLDDDDPTLELDPASFIDRQLDLLLQRFERMAVFDELAIGERLAAFAERYERLRRYGSVPDPSTASPPLNTISLDGNASINAAYEIFARTEKRLFDIASISGGIIATGRHEGSLLDLPKLVVTFQAFVNAEKEEEGRARTEEIRQRNTILENYAEIQRLVNRVAARFETPTKDDQDAARDRKNLFDGLTGAPLDQARKVAAMFSSDLFDAGEGVHPAEAAINLRRPLMNLIERDGGQPRHLKSAYDAYASSLGEATRNLDRDVQLLSDEVNQVSRQRNRHFDLATQTLQRMNDLVQNISRGIN